MCHRALKVYARCVQMKTAVGNALNSVNIMLMEGVGLDPPKVPKQTRSKRAQMSNSIS